jgi:hypothetical protein
MARIASVTWRRSRQDHDCAGRTTIAKVEDVPPDGLQVNYHLVIEIEGGKRPACVAELIALHMR